MVRALLTLLCLLGTSCATSQLAGSAGVAPTRAPAPEPDLQRIETPAAVFLVRPAVAPDFKKLLAGEPGHADYFAF